MTRRRLGITLAPARTNILPDTGYVASTTPFANVAGSDGSPCCNPVGVVWRGLNLLPIHLSVCDTHRPWTTTFGRLLPGCPPLQPFYWFATTLLVAFALFFSRGRMNGIFAASGYGAAIHYIEQHGVLGAGRQNEDDHTFGRRFCLSGAQ